MAHRHATLRYAANCAAIMSLICSMSAIGATDPLFDTHEVLEFTLTGPFNQMARDRDAEPVERPGELRFTDRDGQEKTLALQLKPRGHSRRDRDVCAFPPIRFNFDKSENKSTEFAKQNKLKLVTHCRSSESWQKYVLKEYLVYRLYNELTPVSFNVRLVTVTYDDSESNRDPFTRYGFLIEHKKRLAKRLDTKLQAPTERIPSTQLDSELTALAELFQYLISNTDFSFIAPAPGDPCCHNGVLFAAGDGKYLPVPYDFDRTGLVSPPNGMPDAHLGQRNFRDRVFRGFCHDPAVMAAALDKTRESREAMEQIIASQVGLDQRSKNQTLKFVESYYAIIDNEKKRARELKCRGSQ
jgi:hypothetical protein